MSESNTPSPNPARIMAGRSVVAIASKIAGTAVTFVAQIVLARVLGIRNFGIYIFVITVINVCVIVSKLGFDTVTLRYLSSYLQNNDIAAAKGLRITSDVVVSASSVVAATLGAYFIFRSGRWDTDYPWTLLVVFAASTLAIALTSLRTSALLALGRVAAASAPELFVRPIVIIIILLGLWLAAVPVSAIHGLWTFVIAVVISLVVATTLLLRNLPGAAPTESRRYETSDWTEAGLIFLLAAIGYHALTQVHILIVGTFLSSEVVGGYAAAARVAVYVQLLLVAIQSTAAPMISAQYSAGNVAGAQQVIDVVSAISSLSGLLLGSGVFIFADCIMSLFGAGFEESADVLRVLALGHLARCLLGPTGIAMNMTGHQRAALVTQLVYSVATVVLAILLVPTYGAIAAAIVVAIAIVFWNATLAALLRWWTGLKTWPQPKSVVLTLRALQR